MNIPTRYASEYGKLDTSFLARAFLGRKIRL
jgi:hypothetical protein